jgi:hypothetical protein
MLSNRLSYLPSPGDLTCSVSGRLSFRVLRCCMDVLRVLVIAWGAVGAVLLVLLGYRGTLTRYEEDQIFLNDAVTVEAQQQGDIQRKLLQIRPFLVAMLWTIGALTAVILGMFIRDMLVHLL